MHIFMNKNRAQAETFYNVDLDLHVYATSAVIKSFTGDADFVVDDTNIGTMKKYLTINTSTLALLDTDDSNLPILGVFLHFDTQTKPILMLRDSAFEDRDIANVEVAGGSYGDLVNLIFPYLKLTTATTTFSTRYVTHLTTDTYALGGFDNLVYKNEFDSAAAEAGLTVTRVSDGTNVFNSSTGDIDLSQAGSYIVTVGTINYDNIVDLPIRRPHVPWFSYKLTVM